jgi:hypothetical protein
VIKPSRAGGAFNLRVKAILPAPRNEDEKKERGEDQSWRVTLHKIPYFESVLATGRDDQLAARVNRQRCDRRLMSTQDMDTDPIVNPPDAECVILRQRGLIIYERRRRRRGGRYLTAADQIRVFKEFQTSNRT